MQYEIEVISRPHKTRYHQFVEFIREAGQNPDEFPVWKQQFFLLETGILDGRIHDDALIAYSRLEA